MKLYLKALILRVIHKAIRQFIKPAGIMQNPYISGKVIPMQEEKGYFIVEKPDFVANQNPDAIPQMPSTKLRMGYGETSEEYLESGRKDIKVMLDILALAGEDSQTLSKVLELGCAAGRMLQFYPYHENKSEIWGVDIMSECISWCQNNLNPRLRFAATTTAPHLPFEDNYFDLVYCGSIFTHVSDLADAWFLELSRILRKGGFMYITIHDQNTIKILLDEYNSASAAETMKHRLGKILHEIDAKTSILSKNYASFSVDSDPVSQVFYDAEYIIERWSSFANFVSKTENAYGYQTAVVFQKSL